MPKPSRPFKIPKKYLVWIWGILMLGMVFFVFFRMMGGPITDTGLLSLLPKSEQNPVLADTNELLSRRASQIMAFVIVHSDSESAQRIADQFTDEIQASGLVKSILTGGSSEIRTSFYDLYFPMRYQFIAQKDRETLLSTEGVDLLIHRLKINLFTPASAFVSGIIPEDPFLFFIEYLRGSLEFINPFESKPTPTSGEIKEGESHVFIALEWNADTFNARNQDQVFEWVSDFKKGLSDRGTGAKLYSTGVLSFARAQRVQAQKELFLISLGSFAIVLSLVWIVFKSPTTMGILLIPVCMGFVAGLATTLALFGRIHIVTLTFGTTLIGCAIDYPIHYLAHRSFGPLKQDPMDTLHRLGPGLFMGMVTSVMGYMALAAAPFPGLQQIAVFSSVGLAIALLTVYAWLPHLSTHMGIPGALPHFHKGVGLYFSLFSRFWNRNAPKRNAAIFFCLFLGIGIGLSRTHFNDDIRRLQNNIPALLQEDARVRQYGDFGGNRFILVEASTEEELLKRQESLFNRLTVLGRKGDLSSFQCLAPFIASFERQDSNAQLIRSTFLKKELHVRQEFKKIGLSPFVADRFFNDLRQPPLIFKPDQWLGNPASERFRHLWIGRTPHGYASTALAGGVTNSATLARELHGMPGVRLFDQVEEYSNLLSRYRTKSMVLVVGAAFVAGLFLLFRYGIRGGGYAMIPPLSGVLIAFSVLGWLHIPLTIFHTLAAVLVMAMGMDYTIFFLEASRCPELKEPSSLSVSLSACTTMGSFGLLSLCGTPAISALGQTAFLGLLVSFFLSPLPLIAGQRKSES
ncbi:MAG: MMPL family transporter [Elusimicrobia bacterium]|jgi:predicted exporter|nr:MMPL family transporter [Elusimicrobiota bacterium]